jgi:hypothetical protein
VRARPHRCYASPQFSYASDDFGPHRIGDTIFPVELSVRLSLKRFLFSDDVDDNAAGATIVNGCRTVGPPALA